MKIAYLIDRDSLGSYYHMLKRNILQAHETFVRIVFAERARQVGKSLDALLIYEMGNGIHPTKSEGRISEF